MTERVESPCIRICCLDDDDVCLGCFRTLTEITQWTLVDNASRLAILTNARHRQQAYTQPALRVDKPL
ncbi:MAG: DUF1289 domain-containing protein [Methylovulum sp.]|nr:DUF1289 domain-containing protein [Methylovulum sp.]